MTEEQRDTLLRNYEEAMGNRQPKTMTTRAATREEPRSISALKYTHHSSFMPRAIHDLGGKHH